jgi:hypothetical protein
MCQHVYTLNEVDRRFAIGLLRIGPLASSAHGVRGGVDFPLSSDLLLAGNRGTIAEH